MDGRVAWFVLCAALVAACEDQAHLSVNGGQTQILTQGKPTMLNVPAGQLIDLRSDKPILVQTQGGDPQNAPKSWGAPHSPDQCLYPVTITLSG